MAGDVCKFSLKLEPLLLNPLSILPEVAEPSRDLLWPLQILSVASLAVGSFELFSVTYSASPLAPSSIVLGSPLESKFQTGRPPVSEEEVTSANFISANDFRFSMSEI